MDNYGYKQTRRMFNTFCFSTATVTARTRVCVTVYGYCLSFFFKYTTYIKYRLHVNLSNDYLLTRHIYLIRYSESLRFSQRSHDCRDGLEI